MPYTIVLTPVQGEKYVQASQSLFGHLNTSYLLNNKGTSSPHITVVQFDCSEVVAFQIWKEVLENMKDFKSFSPPFSGVAFVDGTGVYEGTTWVELSVKRGGSDSPIMKVHNVALSVLKNFGIKPLNAVGNDYRPHLTLARIGMPKEIQAWPQDLCRDTVPFHLELGVSDEKWQYANTLAKTE